MAYSFKSSISFGLVYIPVKLVAAVKNNDISFNQIDKKTKSRVKYQKTCTLCGGRIIENEDIIKGYEYEKGKYVFFDEEDFEKIKSKKDKTIAIEQFVDLKEIDPIYYDKAYYLVPEKTAENAYALLAGALKKENKVGIAKTVLGSKEVVVALRVKESSIIANTMFFYEEMQNSPVNIETKVSDKELDLAKMIVNNMAGKFEPNKFKDEYREKLAQAIQTKIAGNQITPVAEGKVAHITDLMEALKLSLKQTQKTAPASASKIKKAN